MGNALLAIAAWFVLVFIFIVPRWDPDKVPKKLLIRRLVQLHLVFLADYAAAKLVFWLGTGWW